MKEMNGTKVFEGFDRVKEAKARNSHKCSLCGKEIENGNKYFNYVERETGYEKRACSSHYNEEIMKEYKCRREKYFIVTEQIGLVELETDASGSEGERWAFIVRVKGREVYRAHGYTPQEIKDITPAEGYAILEAVRWLIEAENSGQVEKGLPICIGSDNKAVLSKLETQSERGRYSSLWQQLNEILHPWREAGRLFVGIKDYSTADRFASKEAFKSEK